MYDKYLREETGQAPQVVRGTARIVTSSCVGMALLPVCGTAGSFVTSGVVHICDSVPSGMIPRSLLLCNKPEGVKQPFYFAPGFWGHGSFRLGAGRWLVTNPRWGRCMCWAGITWTSFLLCLAATWLGQGPQVGQWPEHLPGASPLGLLRVC